jgi:hypothetical protein
MAKDDKKGSLMISRGKNDTSSQEDGSFASKGPDTSSYEGGPETMPEPKPKGGGVPSRAQLLANLDRMRAQLNGGGPSINPDELLGRNPVARPGMPGGPGLPAFNPMAQPTVTPTHGSDAAGPGMGGYRPDPYAVSKLGQDADKEFSRIQQERAQITPKAPTDDVLYQEMLKLYGGG